MDTLLARPARGQEEEDEGEEEGEGWNRNMQMSSHTSNSGGMNEVAAQQRRGPDSENTQPTSCPHWTHRKDRKSNLCGTRADPVQPQEANEQHGGIKKEKNQSMSLEDGRMRGWMGG